MTLYQTWKSHKLPKNYQKNWDDWDQWCKKHSINHILLDDKELRDLVAKHYPQYLDFYDHQITENIERVDFSRLVMMALGGVYADLDTYPSKTNDPIVFVKSGKIVLGSEPKEHTLELYLRDRVLCNAFMISPSTTSSKNFWEKVMEHVVKNYEGSFRPVENTGPMALTRFYEMHPEAFPSSLVTITGACEFFPMVADGQISKECPGLDKSYVVHEWTNSWSPKFWKSAMWNNKRHWMYILLIFLGILFLMIAARM